MGPEELSLRLKARHGELEQAVLARVCALADPTAAPDPGYPEGLRGAVSAAVGYAIAGLAHRADSPAPVPAPLLEQARLAARNGVSLDIVLRRYLAGHILLGDFLVGEAEGEDPLSAPELRRALRTESVLFDRLLDAVSAAYGHELQTRNRDGERRRVRRVEMLLAGELIDASALDYELEGWHLAAVAAGPGARSALRALAAELQRRQLAVCPGGETIWAWFGGGLGPLDSERVKRAADNCVSPEIALAIGEPAHGTEGWRRSHRQALAALPIALRGSQHLIRYAEVALLASALRDEVLAGSLRELYLDPLGSGHDGGEALRRTLSAYFEAERQVSATAAALGVSRQTVSTRLRAIEERLGSPLESCAAELETAFRLRELSGGH